MLAWRDTQLSILGCLSALALLAPLHFPALSACIPFSQLSNPGKQNYLYYSAVCFGELSQLTETSNKHQSLHKAGKEILPLLRLSDNKEDENATLFLSSRSELLQPCSWTCRGAWFGFILLSKGVPNSALESKCRTVWSYWDPENNEALEQMNPLNKSSSKFISRPIIMKQFAALEWAQLLGFHPAPCLFCWKVERSLLPGLTRRKTDLSVFEY